MSIPNHAVVYMGGWNIRPYTYYALWKDGHLLVVQVECLAIHDWTYYRDPVAQKELDRQYFDVLDTIHSLIDSIEFERTNWAYLTKGSRGFRLQQKKKIFSNLSVTPWAPFIDESEITWKKFILDCEHRVGEWKGQEVDVFCVWDDMSWTRLGMMMMNHRALDGLDVTFKVIGHLVRDGAIVGLVTEPMVGEEVTARDRSLVYDAVSKLQNHGFLLHRIGGRMLISKGKVRLISMGHKTFTYYPPEKRAELDALAEKEHWTALSELFANFQDYFTHWPAVRRSKANYDVLPQIPSPERPFISNISLMLLDNKFQKQWQYRLFRTKAANLFKLVETVASSAVVLPPAENSDTDQSSSEPLALIPDRNPARKHRFRPYLIRS